MIHWRTILQLAGFLTLGLVTCEGIALAIAVIGSDEGVAPLLKASAGTAVLGAFLTLLFRSEQRELSRRDAIVLVVLSWVLIGTLGGLPFYFSKHFPSFTDAVFESVSGFTTTGSSILSDIEALPDSLLFWRNFANWLGGFGIILLMIAVLPLVGTGGLALYQAEFSGARSEKIKARVAETALSLWKVYIGLSIIGYVALRWAGMRPLDAATHVFSAVATGGFSTKNISIEAFDSLTIEIILSALMIAGAVNFTLHYRLWVRGQVSRVLSDTEIRFFVVFLVVVWATVTLDRWTTDELGIAARQSMFNVVSIVTTTGYSSTDFGKWSSFAQLLLLASMYVGGCTGATAGGLKSARVVLLAKVIRREFKRMIGPRQVPAVRFGGGTLEDPVIQSLLNLVLLVFMFDFVATLLLTATGMDIVTSISAVAATMFNVGPGLEKVGPASNFGHLPVTAKWVLTACMVAGRLEFYVPLVLFTRRFWQG